MRIDSCLFVLISTLLIITSFLYIRNVPAKGDEVHYLVNAISIIRDQDLALENNYVEDGIDRHTVVGRDGHEYLYHGLGLFPFIISLGYFGGERLGATFLNTIFALLLFFQIFQFSFEISKKYFTSLITTFILFLNLPLAQFTFLLFPEIIGALLILTITRYFIFRKTSLFLVSFLIGILPWIHIRFLLPSLVFLTLLLVDLFKEKTAKSTVIISILIPISLIISYFGFLNYIYGSFNPTWAYQLLNIKTDTGNFWFNLLNIFLDRQYGLLFYSPIFIFAFPGFLIFFNHFKKAAILVLLILVTYLIPILRYIDWHGGYAPPARYLVAILPLIIPILVLFISTNKNLITYFLISIFVLWGIFTYFFSLLSSPNHGFVFMDGTAKYLEITSNYLNLNLISLTPAYYPNKSIDIQHIFWLLILTFFIYLIYKRRNQAI